MLETLRIRDYALIDDLEVDFRQGFNVLTGETGAGKSIIVGALNLVLGTRASVDVVRQGARKAKVDAIFRVPNPSRRLKTLLTDLDIEVEDGELVLSRVVTAEGRSRAQVSGNLTPVSVLAAIGDELVDLHGQHEHQSLLKSDRQLELLDVFAGLEEEVGKVGETVAKLRETAAQVEALETSDREQARRVEFLRFEVDEIDKAGFDEGEEEKLRARRNLITNAERIVTLAGQASGALYEDDNGSAVDRADAALSALDELADIDGRYQAAASRLLAARAEMEELAAEVRSVAEGLEFDAQELDGLNERLALLSDLKRKYGASIEAILAYRAEACAGIEAFETRDKRLAELQAKRDALRERAEKTAGTLSRKRKGAARELDKAVTSALQKLGMEGGQFKAAIEKKELSSTGFDGVEFQLTANPGEPVKSLRQVASGGGEISRVMLAIKSVFAGADRIPTLIFDEIDAGVGGQTATFVAEQLEKLAQSHQTICITHIAQIAAAAEAHYHVAKATRKGRTTTALKVVEGDARVQEVARLLDGAASDVSLDHARALLER